MGLVSGNRLNRFWKKGVKPIKDAIGVLTALSTVDKETLVGAINELAEKKFDAEKVIASTNITEPGFAMDGKTASEAFAELYSNLTNEDIISFTPLVGTNYSGYGNCYYYKKGSRVHVHVGLQNLTPNSTAIIFTLPQEYRPYTQIYAKGTGTSLSRISTTAIIDANGSISVTTLDGDTYFGADIDYDAYS